MTKRMIPELLAPAGGPQALAAAVENGADAVYLGGSLFSARAGAENFTREQLIAALRYAHLRGVRVYVTVNTLVDNGEFGDLADYLFFLFREGVDALLVQDLGVIHWLREVLPDFPLHASTQMTVHNAAGVDWLQSLGFQRAVLARETSRDDLRSISEQTQLELEVFVHGALCFCYSGQCLFSSMVGGRSGNRGRCAQPCRMTYRLLDEEGQDLSQGCGGEHLLSPKDLNLVAQLPELIELGISSLKIEGRMKRPEYVATVVRVYREALDRAAADPQHFQVEQEQLRDLAQIFNRDFTSGYFYENPRRQLIGYSRPNNRGLALGRVQQFGSGKIASDTKLPLRQGDGLEVWTSKGGHEGLTVHSILVRGREVEQAEAGSRVELPVAFQARAGDRIFKTHDSALIEQAQQSYQQPSRRRLPLAVQVSGRIGEPLVMRGRLPDGRTAEVAGEVAGEAAVRHPLDSQAVREKVDRLGNTPFTLESFECRLDQGLIYPLSEINGLRRRLTDELEQRLLQGFAREVTQAAEERRDGYWANVRRSCRAWPAAGRTRLAVAVADSESLEAALAGGAEIVYLGGPSWQGRTPWTSDNLARGIGLCHERQTEAVLILPRIWQDHDCLLTGRLLEQAAALGADGLLAGDPGGLHLALKSGLPVTADFSLPLFNDPALLMLHQLGVRRLTLSPELNREQLFKLSGGGGPLEQIVHGRLPLMISEHCVTGAVTGNERDCPGLCRRSRTMLRDRRGYLFPLQSDELCRMTLFNARVLCLAEYLEEIAGRLGVVRLDLRSEQADAVQQITGLYRRGLKRLAGGGWGPGSGRELWERLSAITPSGLTRGHYLRGVLQVDSEGAEA
jgi:putative protease